MKESVLYCLNESFDNIETASILLGKRKYLDSMFFCHLTMGKMLKAFYSNEKDKVSPKIHNLLVLAQKSAVIKQLA